MGREMTIDEAADLLSKKMKEAHEMRFDDLMCFVKTVYRAISLAKNDLRPQTILSYRRKHRKAIINAIKAGSQIPMDVFRIYPDLKAMYLSGM